MTTIPASHWTAATRALLDHIDEHQLPMPTEIAPDPASRFGDQALDVRVAWDDYPAWVNSLTIRDESVELTHTKFGDMLRMAYKATLPALGVRIDLRTSKVLSDEQVPA